MAKVRKKFSKYKQLTRAAEHFVKGKVICYIDSMGGCVVLDTKTTRIVPPESQEGRVIMASLARPYKWSCFIAVFGRTQFDEYMKAEQLHAPDKYFQADLAPIFEEHHTELAKRVPDHQRCGVGWIADPMGGDLTEQDAGRIFEKLGAWND